MFPIFHESIVYNLLVKNIKCKAFEGPGYPNIALILFLSLQFHSQFIGWDNLRLLIVAEIHTPISMEARCLPFRPSAKYNAAPSGIISHVSPRPHKLGRKVKGAAYLCIRNHIDCQLTIGISFISLRTGLEQKYGRISMTLCDCMMQS